MSTTVVQLQSAIYTLTYEPYTYAVEATLYGGWGGWIRAMFATKQNLHWLKNWWLPLLDPLRTVKDTAPEGLLDMLWMDQFEYFEFTFMISFA